MRNTSDKDLRITKVDASCSCIKSEWPRVPIGPGQEVEITSVFDPSSFQVGKIKKYALLYISPGRKLANVSFEGEIDREVDFKPIRDVVSLKAIRPDSHWEFSSLLTLNEEGKKSFKFLGLTGNDHISHSFLPVPGGYRLNLRSKEKIIGSIKEKISIKYSLADKVSEKKYQIIGYAGNVLKTYNDVIRVPLKEGGTVKVKKNFDIQFPDLINLSKFKISSKEGVNAEFSLEGKKLTAELEFPAAVMRKKFVGNLLLEAEGLPSKELIFVVQ